MSTKLYFSNTSNAESDQAEINRIREWHPLIRMGIRSKLVVAGIIASTSLYLFANITLLLQLENASIPAAVFENYTRLMSVSRSIALASACCYLIWSVRAYMNAKSLLQMRDGGALAIWGWILPVGNLMLPCLVLMRIMNGSLLSKGLKVQHFIVIGWWIALLSFAVTQRIRLNTTDIDVFTTLTYLSMVFYLLSGSALLYCVMKSTSLQHRYINEMPSILEDDPQSEMDKQELELRISLLQKAIASIRLEKYLLFYAVYFPLALAGLVFIFIYWNQAAAGELTTPFMIGNVVGLLLGPALIACPALLYGLKADQYKETIRFHRHQLTLLTHQDPVEI